MKKYNTPAPSGYMSAAVENDEVNSPAHYITGDIEVIDYIQDKLTPEEFTGYCMGNVLKYVSRWRHKGGVIDMEKAQWYLAKAIEDVGEEQRGKN